MFTERTKIDYFSNILKKLEKKLVGWKAKLLSLRGRIILIKHVLHSLFICSIVVVDPLKQFSNAWTLFVLNFYGKKKRICLTIIGLGG